MEEIELREYFLILWKRMWLVILITVLSVGTSGAISFFVLEPEYETFTTLMLSKPTTGYNTSDFSIQYNDVLLNQKLVPTYGEIAKSKVVSNEVISNLGLNMSSGELRQKVNVSLVNNTEIIKVVVNDGNPQMAAEIANETAQVFMRNVKEIMKIENVQVIDKAEVPTSPIKPRPMLNIAIAGVLGVMISVFLIFMLEYLDNTIKTPDDVERYLELPVLGMIPKSTK